MKGGGTWQADRETKSLGLQRMGKMVPFLGSFKKQTESKTGQNMNGE